MKMRSLLVLGLFILPVLTPAATAQETPVKIGYIDIEEINRNYSKIVNAVELLNDVLKQRQSELDVFYDQVQKAQDNADSLQADYENETGSDRPSATKVRDAVAVARDMDETYRNQFRDHYVIFEQVKDELLYPILIDVTEAVREVGNSGGYSVIIKKDLARFADSDNDVTGRVLDLLEEKAAQDRQEERERLRRIEANTLGQGGVQ